MEAELRERGLPVLSLETARPLTAFDLVGFSLQYELTYTNILAMLELGGIPRWSAERGEDDPLVVAGGPVATHAEPLAPFIDVLLIGDGEEKTPELMQTWAKLRDEGLPRAERLAHIARLGGFYVPSLYRTAEDPETGKKGWRYIPHVVEPAAGATRGVLAVLCDAYDEEPGDECDGSQDERKRERGAIFLNHARDDLEADVRGAQDRYRP